MSKEAQPTVVPSGAYEFIIPEGLGARERELLHDSIARFPAPMVSQLREGEFQVLMLQGALVRLDIERFSSLNKALTDIAAFQATNLTAFPVLSQARHAQAAEYDSLSGEQARVAAAKGQQRLVETLNELFNRIEKVIAPFGGVILNIEGDAVNMYFPEDADDTGGMFTVNHRAMSAGVRIQDIFRKREDLKARVGVRYTATQEFALLGASSPLVFLTGKPFQELCEIESSTSEGAVGTDSVTSASLPENVMYNMPRGSRPRVWKINGNEPVVSSRFASWGIKITDRGIYKPPIKGGEIVYEIQPEKLPRARRVKPKSVVLGSESSRHLISLLGESGSQRSEVKEHVPVVVSYGAIEGLTLIGVRTKERLRYVDETIQKISVEFGIRFLKTGIDAHGQITLLAIHQGEAQMNDMNSAEASLRGFLTLRDRLMDKQMLFRAGIASGTVVRAQVGSQYRIIDDAMGMAVNLAARLEQHLKHGGILIDEETFGQLMGSGIEPTGEHIVLTQIKGFPEGVPAFSVEGITRVQETEALLNADVVLISQFQERLLAWAKRAGIDRMDWEKIFAIVKEYVSFGQEEIPLNGHDVSPRMPSREILSSVLFPLLRDLRADKTIFEIQKTIASAAATSVAMQEFVKAHKQFQDVLFLASVLTGGRDFSFYEQTLCAVASVMKLDAVEFLEYLERNHLIRREGQQVHIWPTLQRRVYESLDVEKRRNLHGAIASHLALTDGKTIESIQALVFHAYESVQRPDDQLADLLRMYIPRLIQHCRSTDNWEGVMLYSEWLAKISTKEQYKQLYVLARMRQGEAQLHFGDFERAYNNFKEVEAVGAYSDECPSWEVQVDRIFADALLEKHTSEDPQEAQKAYKAELDDALDKLWEHLDKLKGNSLAQAKILRRVGEILSKTGGIGAKIKPQYKAKIEPLYADGQFRQLHPAQWGLVASTVGRLDRNTDLINDAIVYVTTRSDVPERAYTLATLYLAKATLLIIDKASNEEIRETFLLAKLHAHQAGDYRKILDRINNQSDWEVKNDIDNPNLQQRIEEGIAIADAMRNWYLQGAVRELMGLYYLQKAAKTPPKNSAQKKKRNQFTRQALEYLETTVRIFTEHFAYGNEGLGMILDDISELTLPRHRSKVLKQFLAAVKKTIDEAN